jgi:hypothetical protein
VRASLREGEGDTDNQTSNRACLVFPVGRSNDPHLEVQQPRIVGAVPWRGRREVRHTRWAAWAFVVWTCVV